MRDLTEDVVNTAHNFVQNMQQYFDTPLDYSIESLEEIDEMLDGLGARRTEMTEDAFFDLYSMTGCYVFETARRNYGGQYFWIQEEQQPGLAAGHPDLRGVIKVWEKVIGRLSQGEEDNIPYYIAGYKEHIEIGKTKPGYHVTIV